MPDPDPLLEKLSGPPTGAAGDTERPLWSAEVPRLEPDLPDRLLGIDPNVDRSGVPSLSFRAQLSMMDSDEERKWWLSKRVGQEGWTQDRFGNFALTPGGMQRLGLESKSGKPVLIDEPYPTRYDLADWAGSAPAIAAGVGTGMAVSGVGLLPGMALTGLGTAAGKAVGEAAEQAAGMNIQSTGDIAKQVGTEGLYGVGGEGVGRGLLAVGRKAMAPYRGAMTPEVRELAQEARDIGARPKAVQITKAPLIGRFSGLADNIFGDRLAAENSRALNAELNNLRGLYGRARDPSIVGTDVAADIGKSRKAMTRWAGIITDRIDQATGGLPVVPTARIKTTAAEILEGLPKTQTTERVVTSRTPAFEGPRGNIYKHTRDVKTTGGRPVLTAKNIVGYLQDIQQLPDFASVSAMQNITNTLWDAVDDTTIIPGLSSRNARLLWSAATDSYDDVTDPLAKSLVKKFRTDYKTYISRFDNALVQRITLDPKYASQIAPERVVGTVFRKGNVKQIKQLKNVLTPARWEEVQGAAMESVLSKVTGRTDDPLVEAFRGKQFLTALDSYGRETLYEMFGRPAVDRLYRLGRVIQLVTYRATFSGGIVAASVALHPLRNVSKLVKIRLLSKLLNTPKGVKWLTEGLDAPKTRLGSTALTRLAVMTNTLAEQGTRGLLDEQPERRQ